MRLIWIVDPQCQKISVHLPGSEQQVNLTGDALLNGGDVLPGFEARVKALFG